MSFLAKLGNAISRSGSRLCIGLDPTIAALPAGLPASPVGLLEFNRAIIEATAEYACAYKPNLAFYEALGSEGWRVLEETIRAIPEEIPVIADAKRGDIGSTAAAYAAAIFDHLGCDAVTLSPYLGYDAVSPFIEQRDGFAFMLCRTSNPSAGEMQDLLVETQPLYQRVARIVSAWNRPESCGLVIGATDPKAAGQAAACAPDLWLLVPGVGAQGGEITATATALGRATSRAIWPVSRGITSAGRGKDYAEQARAAARHYAMEIAAATEMVL